MVPAGLPLMLWGEGWWGLTNKKQNSSVVLAPRGILGGAGGVFPPAWSIPGRCLCLGAAAQPGSIVASLGGLPRGYLGFKERSESHYTYKYITI